MNKQNLKLFVLVLFTMLVAFAVKSVFLAQTVAAKPAFMDRYKRDPYAKAELKNKCTICHIGRGGGERNDFGEAFEDAGFRITPRLREKFPDLFNKQESKAE